ncbi:uncharacterized protein H6S33_007637 [Morchella sextelata]|jgi:hypothetical protein|uniref:uncharacterized protein n=1 Tax=Morchella sextelata TaxID=1174677 RepID=UPI001D0407BB|nr:uncharacterized protein H6S33_007637 [Morchella sextelata]KAH0603315.1 hypothetical protein H6S33_007637 [Morchella sextelata]
MIGMMEVVEVVELMAIGMMTGRFGLATYNTSEERPPAAYKIKHQFEEPPT